MFYHKKEQKTDEVEQIIPKDSDTDVKPPKSVKPLSGKHFKPILEKVASIENMQKEIAEKQSEILAYINEQKGKIKFDPEKNEIPPEPPKEEIK
jgi:hypothetical protein